MTNNFTCNVFLKQKPESFGCEVFLSYSVSNSNSSFKFAQYKYVSDAF